MNPTEIRRRVLQDHEALRERLVALAELARQVADGDTDQARTLRGEAALFLEVLGTHMKWEDRFLRPALADADAWGKERVARLDADHREQREVLAAVLDRLLDGTRPAPLVARDVLDLVELLRRDMAEEEQDLLDPRVLRDDVVTIDGMSG
ncbi:MAG: hemerythrin domain-containing protein [Myxococcota bacterium]|nr:hemerythrin domain-containing protein [Myxococcota bacterium]